MNETSFNVGVELRRAREAKKLSLRGVASAVGVSASLLSQVETGKTQPSVSTLYALVNHLGISLDNIMTGQIPKVAEVAEPGHQDPSDVVQRAGNNPKIVMDNGVTWERLSDGGSKVADPLLVTYPPGASSSMEGKLMRHVAMEYGYILTGSLQLQLEFETLILNPGDSFCFDATRPHLFKNDSNATVQGIWFVIGSKETSSYQSLEDLGHQPNSAVDVLRMMNR